MAEQVLAVISIGSNIEKERNVPEAIRLLRRAPHVTIIQVSRIFESASVGGPEDAPEFFNAAVLVSTDLSYEELRDVAHAVEDELGRRSRLHSGRAGDHLGPNERNDRDVDQLTHLGAGLAAAQEARLRSALRRSL